MDFLHHLKLIVVLTSVVGFTSGFNYKPKTKLQFNAGAYSNILVGINPEFDETQCDTLVKEIQNILSSTSSQLYAATDGGAYFSLVKILVPWRCQSSGAQIATAADYYQVADFKITDSHPLAQFLPWTRQYKNCGAGSEDIFVPGKNFAFPSAPFDVETKGKILLHEWIKWRFGVFEEYGHYDDELYSACYQQGGVARFSSCSDSQLPIIFNGTEAGGAECRRQVDEKREDLLGSLGRGSSSLMSMPHLETVTKLCNDETHNKHAPTKQNIMCYGRSVKDVLQQHPDQVMTRHSRKSLKQLPATEFKVIRNSLLNGNAPGYVFIVENSELIRTQERLRHIKQALTSIIDLLPLNSMAALSLFQGGVYNNPINQVKFEKEEDKAEFIKLLPDQETPTMAQKLNESGFGPQSFLGKQAQQNINVTELLKNVLDSTKGLESYSWHFYLITNTESTSLQEARDLLHSSDATMSILTFEDEVNPLWLEMYGTSNTKNFLPLPNCESGTQCSHMSTLILDDFLETLRWQHIPIYWNKLVEASIAPGQVSTVRIEQLLPQSPTPTLRFYISTFQPNAMGSIRVSNSTGPCVVQSVQDYQYLVSVSGCGLGNITGEWTIDLSSFPDTDPNSQVSIFVDSAPEISAFSSLGVARTKEIDPNQGIPVYTRVSDAMDRPIIEATVQLKLFKPSFSDMSTPSFSLYDDGVFPDVTKNDGVYSSILQDFSQTPSFHTGQVTVTITNGVSKILTSILPSNSAALLEVRMGTKCCGSVIPLENTENLGDGRITSLLPGFKTEFEFHPNLLPPSRIGHIFLEEDTKERLGLQFTAPSVVGDVALYQSCCSYLNSTTLQEISSCYAILPQEECTPVGSGLTQHCNIYKLFLAEKHILEAAGNISKADLGEEKIFLSCSLRGVSHSAVAGPSSIGTLEVGIIPQEVLSETRAAKCDSISDDCLPIAYFWGLIGCVAGLLLIILILSICWCVMRNKKKSSNSQEVLMSKNRSNRNFENMNGGVGHDKGKVDKTSVPLPNKDSPLYNVYVNKAYIQDSDGSMKLVAADGQLLPLDNAPDNLSDITIEPHPSRFSVKSKVNTVPPLRRNSEDNNLKDDMTIYKSKPHPPPKPSRPTSNNFKFQFASPSDDSAPVPRNRLQRPQSGYANSTARPEDDIEEFPVYASVNRTGRRTPTLQAQPNNLPISGFSTFRPKPSPKQIPPNFGKFSKDDSNLPVQNRFNNKQIQQRPTSQPIMQQRFDAFPSSESDTYSDMSRGVAMAPKPPPVPPPFPATSQSQRGVIKPQRQSNTLPPSYKPPPPPPPPQQVTPTAIMRQDPVSDDEYDDDSEHWDDDEFDIRNARVSYA